MEKLYPSNLDYPYLFKQYLFYETFSLYWLSTLDTCVFLPCLSGSSLKVYWWTCASGQDRITEIRFAFLAVIRKQVNIQKPQTKYMRRVSNTKQSTKQNNDPGEAEANEESPTKLLAYCLGTVQVARESHTVPLTMTWEDSRVQGNQGSWSLETRELCKQRALRVCKRVPWSP